jgi:hypothetical protein
VLDDLVEEVPAEGQCEVSGFSPYGRAPRDRPHLMLGTPLTACLQCNGSGYGRSKHESTCRYAAQAWEAPKAAESDLAEWTIGPDQREVRLTKRAAAALDKPGMRAFLADLSTWAERLALDGYTIHSEPDEGPGTMVWRATR